MDAICWGELRFYGSCQFVVDGALNKCPYHLSLRNISLHRRKSHDVTVVHPQRPEKFLNSSVGVNYVRPVYKIQ